MVLATLTTDEVKEPEELQKELNELEFQMFRMQENLKQIAKRWQVLGIEQTKEEKWVIVYIIDDGSQCKIMLNECDSAFRGVWDFSIQATYADDHTIHIGDIKGEENKGYGSICMNYLKNHAMDQNVQYITGDIAQRDWDHLDRLIHFYEKHHFDIEVDHNDKSGDLVWNPAS
ncbi:hypothetical protein RYX45_07690 [Alkalihalophilus pseudofirmus]|uniref:Uncharacterized protein n=1 Tax=Alkalihalophilus pseudofirmus TaxID=79885 RepID=A0AAJ2L1E1_ALKPS|nr:hypothetical protein [Alkalihalophilus pseudofirmus]MDV2885059.1 hypothetical protein [Alkalihalophilus pseudofirmus]